MRTLNLKEHLIALTGKMPQGSPFGIVAEVDSPGELVRVAAELRRTGYRRYDAHAPFPVHGIDRAMGLRGSLVPWMALGGGLTGCVGGLALQIWLHAFHYPLVFSGKPYLSLPAFIPVTFELTILLAAFGTVGGMFIVNLLPMLYHPLFTNERFRRVTTDGFFIVIEARDPHFDPERTRDELAALGTHHIELLEP